MPAPVETASVQAPPGLKSIGILGGGQLAWMLAEAAAPLGIAVHVQTPNPEDPAVALAASAVVAPVEDGLATRELARRCEVISFENEWLPLDQLELLAAEGIEFRPGLHALCPLVDKRSQRQLLDDLHLPCPRWCPLEQVLQPPSGEDDRTARPGGAATSAPAPGAPPFGPSFLRAEPPQPRLPEGFHFPLMAKAIRGGYDGRGTRPLADQAALEALLATVDPATWILEELVEFERELALTACRDLEGNVACFPLVQTHQHRQVCDWVLYPAPADHAVQAFARNVAASLLTALNYVGVLSIEFFWGPRGLQVNELAPRTHNSGHLTIEAFRHSQFDQQLRIVSGLPMGPIEPRLAGALMVNLLGFRSEPGSYEDERQALERLPGAHLHWYGKSGSGLGRKLGHLTLELDPALGDDGARQRQVDRLLAEVRSLWPLPPQE